MDDETAYTYGEKGGVWLGEATMRLCRRFSGNCIRDVARVAVGRIRVHTANRIAGSVD